MFDKQKHYSHRSVSIRYFVPNSSVLCRIPAGRGASGVYSMYLQRDKCAVYPTLGSYRRIRTCNILCRFQFLTERQVYRGLHLMMLPGLEISGVYLMYLLRYKCTVYST